MDATLAKGVKIWDLPIWRERPCFNYKELSHSYKIVLFHVAGSEVWLQTGREGLWLFREEWPRQTRWARVGGLMKTSWTAFQMSCLDFYSSKLRTKQSHLESGTISAHKPFKLIFWVWVCEMFGPEHTILHTCMTNQILCIFKTLFPNKCFSKNNEIVALVFRTTHLYWINTFPSPELCCV